MYLASMSNGLKSALAWGKWSEAARVMVTLLALTGLATPPWIWERPRTRLVMMADENIFDRDKAWVALGVKNVWGVSRWKGWMLYSFWENRWSIPVIYALGRPLISFFRPRKMSPYCKRTAWNPLKSRAIINLQIRYLCPPPSFGILYHAVSLKPKTFNVSPWTNP